MCPQRGRGGSFAGQPDAVGQNRWRRCLARGCGPPTPLYEFDTSAADWCKGRPASVNQRQAARDSAVRGAGPRLAAACGRSRDANDGGQAPLATALVEVRSRGCRL
jgi:hypothetical protein